MKHDLLGQSPGNSLLPADAIKLYAPIAEGMNHCGSALCDGYAAMGSEWLAFVNRRLHMDLSLPSRLISCRTPQDYVEEWTTFMKTAADDYRSEFTRLTEMNTKASQRAFSALQNQGQKSVGWPGE